MKSCPTCNRTYPDDTLAFCLMDGAVLSAPYDHQATRYPSDARRAAPPPTEVIPRSEISENSAVPSTMPSPQLSTIQARPPSVPSVNWSDEKASKVRAEDWDRLVKVWEDKVGRRPGVGNRARFVVLRLVAFGLVLLSAFFALRTVQLLLFSATHRDMLGFVLVQALLAFIFGWAARRCWRLAGSS